MRPVLFALGATFSALLGCNHPVDIQPDPAGAGGAHPVTPSSTHAAQGNTASSSVSTGVGTGSGGGAPAGALQVNTPETDPGQYTVVDALIINQGDPPTKVVDGPFMVTDFAPQQGGRAFISPGPNCPASANFASSVPMGSGMRKPVLPGQVLCAAYGTYSDPPNGLSVVSVTGYRPYPL